MPMLKSSGEKEAEAESDLGSATDEYAARFSGDVGRWMLAVQEQAIVPWVEACTAARILDVGGAHGQLAVPLARAGRDVTVTGSVSACEDWLQSRTGATPLPFVLASSLQLPFPERAFEMVLSLRMLTHSDDWRGLIAELCRVAGDVVIVDYPSLKSINVFSRLLFKLKKRVEKNTRNYTVFHDRDISAAFKRHGFTVQAEKRQFFWPMALHRLFNNARVSQCLNRLADAAGLKTRWGSPVIVLAKRDPERTSS